MDLIKMAKEIDPSIDIDDFQRKIERIEAGQHPWLDVWTPPPGCHEGRMKAMLFGTIASMRLSDVGKQFPSQHKPVYTEEELRTHRNGGGVKSSRGYEAAMMSLYTTEEESPQYKSESARLGALLETIKSELDPRGQDD